VGDQYVLWIQFKNLEKINKMKSILAIAILCVSHIGLSKDKIYTLKKNNEIELHNSIQKVISKIDIENLSQKNQNPLKQNLSELATQLKQFNDISKNKNIHSEYGKQLKIKYAYDNFNYYYEYSKIDSTLSFSDLDVYFSKHEIIEEDDNEDNALVYSYSFNFNDDSNLSSLTIDSGLVYRSSEYTEHGAPINHKLRINYKTIGKNYTTFIYSDEINEDIANTLNLKHSKVSVVTNYSGNIDSVISTEFLINHQDTMGYSIGYISRNSTINNMGKWITYYKNGNMALEHSYTTFNNGHSNSKLNGKETYFYNTGDTAVIQFYVNGKLNGKKTEFYAKNKPKMTEYFNDGIRIGEKITYYEDGSIESIERYSKTGVAHGTWITYEQPGLLKNKFHYKHGKYNGVYLQYRHGILIDSCRYVDNKIENYRIKYYDILDFNGNTITSDVIHYKNGQLDGEFISYYNNGITSDSSFYVEGKKHGLSTQFYKDGSLKKKTNYNHGTILSSKSFYLNGKIKQKYELNKTLNTETSSDTSYYENGIISKINTYTNTPTEYIHIITKDSNGNLTSDIINYNYNKSDGFKMEKEGDRIDSILYDSKSMTTTYNNYFKDKLIYHKTSKYGITTEYFSSNLTKKEEGFLRKKTYYVDLSDMDEEEKWDKSYKADYLIGEASTYYINGNTKETKIRTYQGDDWESEITYYKNGSLKTIKTNEEYGDGIHEVNFNKIGQIISNINEMERSAIFNQYYNNDSLKKSIRYYDINIEIIDYYPNGKIKSRTYTEEGGEYDFYSRKYYDNSDYYSKKEEYYNEQGIITKEILSHYNGEETSIILYKNGKIYLEEHYYNNGDYTGINIYGALSTRRTYYPNGNLKAYQHFEYSEIYDETILVKQQTYYESGGIKSKKQWGEYAEKIGDWIYYNDDEILDEEGKTIKEPSIKEKH